MNREKVVKIDNVELEKQIKKTQENSFKSPVEIKLGNYKIVSVPMIERKNEEFSEKTETYLSSASQGAMRISQIESGELNIKNSSKEDIKNSQNILNEVKKAVILANVCKDKQVSTKIENVLNDAIISGDFSNVDVEKIAGARLNRKAKKVVKIVEKQTSLGDVQVRYTLTKQELEEKIANNTLYTSDK